MLSRGGERLTPKVLNHYLHHDLGMLPLLWCFFAHLLILEYPDHHQNLIGSLLYNPRPLYQISSQSVHNFLSNVVHRQTDKQTRSTQRAQTSLAEADHYSHIAHCKNVELLWWFFCSFTHLTIRRSPPKFNQFSLVLLRSQYPSIKFHPNPFITF